MKVLFESYCFKWMSFIWKNLLNIYEHSQLKKMVDGFGKIYAESYFGKLSSNYERNEPFFMSSVIGTGILKIIESLFQTVNKVLDWIVHKIFKCDKFPSLMKNRTIQFEVMTYILALYSILDCLFRKYVADFANIWDELFFILMFMIWVYKGICCRKEQILKRAPLDFSILVFIGVFFVLMLLSPNMVIAIEGFRVLVQYVLWYFTVLQLLKDKYSVKNILMIFTCLVGLLGIYGVYQYVVGVEMPEAWIESSENIRTRVYAIFTSPNIFGSLLVLAIPIAISMMTVEEKTRHKIFYGIISIFMLGSLVFTYSRGAWIGLVCAIGVYVLLKDKRMIVPAAILGILVLIFVPSITNRLLFMFSNDYISSSLRGGRLVRWLTALDILQEHPLTGLGLGQFGGAVAMNHGLSAIVNGDIVETFYMDNNYLKIAVEAGIIGLSIFLWLMYQVFAVSIKTIGITKDREMKELEIGILSGLSGVMFHNLVENVFEVPMMVTMFWMLVAVMMHMWYLNYNALKGGD